MNQNIIHFYCNKIAFHHIILKILAILLRPPCFKEKNIEITQ